MRPLKSVWLVLAISFVLLISLARPATADDLIVSRAYYADPTGLVTYDEVKQQSFTAYENFLNAGYQPGTIWVELVLAKSSEEVVLSVKPPYIDDIDVFYENTHTHSILDGEPRAWSPPGIISLPYAFVFPPAEQERKVYLRFKSAHSYQILIDALPTDEFVKNDRVEQLIYTGYISFSLLLALWLLIIWLIDRNAVVGAFTIQQFMGFLHSFIIAGFAQIFFTNTFSAYFINQLSFVLIVSYPAVGFIANKLILSELGLSKPYDRIARALIVCALVIAVLFLLGDDRVLKWNATLVLVGMLFFWAAAMFGLAPSEQTHKTEKFLVTSFKLYYSVNLLLWMIAILPLLGILNVGAIAFQSLFAYNVLSGLMLFFLLQCRYKYRLESEVARTSTLEMQAVIERKQREELGMMMAMLSHEIKTPLSVLKLVVDEKVVGSDLEGHAGRAIQNISFVINRCLQLGKLDSRSITVERSPFNVAESIRDIVADYGSDAVRRTQITGDPELCCVTDLNIFRIVTSNLIDNTLKYSPANSTIMIKFYRSGKGVASSVSVDFVNEIGGMGAPDASQVFKKYYRNSSATKIPGSGLGLFLVSELSKILGGSVHYEPRATQAVFTLRIPD